MASDWCFNIMEKLDSHIDKYKELKEPHTGIGFGVVSSSGAGGIDASGGIESETGGYKYHIFESNGSSNQTVGTLTILAGSADMEYVVIAGGGGAGTSYGGGGGAGGLITGTLTGQESNVTTYSGKGGAGGAGGGWNNGSNGTNSWLVANSTSSTVAIGGGYGSTGGFGNGGSGAGGWYGSSGGSNTPGSSTQPVNTSDGVNTYNNTVSRKK